MNDHPSCHCGAGDGRSGDTRCKGPSNTPPAVHVSFLPSPAACLAGLVRYRRALDTWHAGPPNVPMPQPHQYGLRLGLMSSSVVLWPGAE